MVVAVRRAIVIVFAGTLGYAGWASAQPTPSDPPDRVGRLAFVNGTVSFHDNDQAAWAPALVNTPLTSGDALWTEPNARSEISIAGTRVRMDSSTQLDFLALDDTQTRLQIDRGRIDIKTFTYDTKQPYQIVTPRGTISLQQQGDYYVEAGSQQDPTRLGVRQGAAQLTGPNGQVLAVRAGEVAEVSGDTGQAQLHTVQAAPPPMPAYWADRDRQVIYDQPPQYVSSNMTGYEDLNAYGGWSNDPEYGQVWAPRSVPSGWEPYRTGRWQYVQPWGWTWVDEQPWGFAPYHYGRWANRNNRWFWVPPQRDLRPVYAPALVAFVGGIELAVTLGQQSSAPVGWFPLGPREAYVPSYTNNRDYYRRMNVAARVQDQVMEDRWQRAQRRDTVAANQQPNDQFMNRRFATVVPAQAFTRSEPVARVALRVDATKVATAPVASVAAPPAPAQSIRATQPSQRAPAATTNRPNDPTARPQPNAPAPNAQTNAQATAQANVPTAKVANMEAIGKPTAAEAPKANAPGPKVAARPAANATVTNEPGKPNASLPALTPRTGAPPPQIQGERRTAPAQQPGQPAAPSAPKPEDNKAATPPPAAPQTAPQPGQANPPQAPRPPQANVRPEPPKPAEAPKPEQRPAEQRAPQSAPQAQPAQRPDQPRPAENHAPQAAPQPAPQPQQAAPPTPPRPEPPRPPENRTAPQQEGRAVAPTQPQRQAAPAPQPQQQAAPQQPQRQAAPPQPAPQQHQQQAQQPPQPQHPAPQPPAKKEDDKNEKK